VILREYDKLTGRKMFGRTAVPSLSVDRILATIDKPFLKGFDELADVSEILVIAVPFSRQNGMDAVMKIIIPLGVQVITSPGRGVQDARIVQIAFGDHRNGAAQFLSLPVNGLPQVK